MERFIIYKITNLINKRYYIGRHRTKDINDCYMGSGKAIKNAIKKYGKENFIKEILAETKNSKELWELESQIVSKKVVDDPLSYNMVTGGKSYLNALKESDPDKFFDHQKRCALKAGQVTYRKMLKDGTAKHWHSTGGVASRKIINSKNLWRITTIEGEILNLNGVEFRPLCFKNGWNYRTLVWFSGSLKGKTKKTIARGPLKGMVVERIK
jgi:hypothetical protein